jgi:hypothetical protein
LGNRIGSVDQLSIGAVQLVRPRLDVVHLTRCGRIAFRAINAPQQDRRDITTLISRQRKKLVDKVGISNGHSLIIAEGMDTRNRGAHLPGRGVMHLRRFTRLTNGHSKTLRHHKAMQAIFFAWYNWVRVNTGPGREAGASDGQRVDRKALDNQAVT